MQLQDLVLKAEATSSRGCGLQALQFDMGFGGFGPRVRVHWARGLGLLAPLAFERAGPKSPSTGGTPDFDPVAIL